LNKERYTTAQIRKAYAKSTDNTGLVDMHFKAGAGYKKKPSFAVQRHRLRVRLRKLKIKLFLHWQTNIA